MELPAWILILTLSGVLLLFLIIGIIVLVRLLQLINEGKQLVGKSSEIVDKTDQVVDNIKQIATVSGIVKLAFDAFSTATSRNSKRANKASSEREKVAQDQTEEF